MKKFYALVSLAVAVMVSPLILGAAGVTIPLMMGAIISGMGLVGLLLLMVGIAVTKLYVRTKANEAFVRTGRGGAIVILDGGAMVFPFLHETVRVPLETMRLDVDRTGPEALITADKLRADLKAEFYIRVQPNKEDVLNAARSLGDRNFNVHATEELVRDKLISALRAVAATRTLDELNAKREEFAAEVKSAVEADLLHNGLTLETVTISSLDQTDPKLLNPHNVFDAQGLRRIAEITQTALVERNLIERQAEQERKKKDVDTRKQILEMERDQAEAEAFQHAEVARVRAEKIAEARNAEIEKDEHIAAREVEKERAIEQAQLAAQQLVIQSRRTQQLEEVERAKTVELAEREYMMAVAGAEARQAEAERLRFEKTRDRSAAEQAVLTVEVTAAAAREAEKKLISAQKAAEEERYRQQVEADIIAYTLAKEAEGKKLAAQAEYEARVRRADAEAEATLRQAEADAESARRRAAGETAVQMVDVNVDRERVQVEAKRVDVERQRVDVEAEALANREKYSEAALAFELEKAKIDADKERQIAVAGALGEFLGQANWSLYGDADSAQAMIHAYMRGMGLGQHVDGFMAGTSDESKAVLNNIGTSLFDVVKTVAERLTGREVTPAEIAKLVESVPIDGEKGAPSGNGKT